MEIKEIGKIYTDFNDKFGLPRQSGLIEGLKGRIVFDKEYRRPEAFRGLEEYSHIWILWAFSDAPKLADGKTWEPTVRPPRLGGNVRVGVFASRSPVRPNPIAMSCVKLIGIDYEDPEGPVLLVEGIDMLSGTPVLDIKPYIKTSDFKPEAVCGFADSTAKEETSVEYGEDCFSGLSEELKNNILAILREDPTPRYIKDKTRIFGFEYAGLEIKFSKDGNTLHLISVEPVSF